MSDIISGNYNYNNYNNGMTGECNIKFIWNEYGKFVKIKFDRAVWFSTVRPKPTTEMTFESKGNQYYEQSKPQPYPPLPYTMILDVNTMVMFFSDDHQTTCEFKKKPDVKEDYCTGCSGCSARAKFVNLKNTWTKQGSTNKTTWLPYNTRGKSLVKKDVKEDYCSSCNGYRYSPNIFTGTTIPNTTPRDQLWKTVTLTDRNIYNGLPYPGLPPKKISDSPHIYNISSRYNTNPHRNPMRYPMNYPVNPKDCDSPSHYKELNSTYCKD